MAIYRLSMKNGTSGSGRAHFDYMTRNGKYSRHDSKSKEDLVYYESNNIPSWAKNDRDFWKEEEKKKDGFKKIELALPNECTMYEKIQMVKDYCEEEFSDRYVYSFAVHEVEGSISGEKNPHAHIMFSERGKEEGREEPTREDFFKKSRTRKDGTISGGYRKDKKFRNTFNGQENSWINNTRKKWADIQNSYLSRYENFERVSEKTLKEQGIDRQAQKHIGYKAVGMYVRGCMSEKMEYYAAVKEQVRLHNDEQEIDAAEQKATGYAVARQKEKQEIDEYRQQLERERDRLLQEQNRRKLEREEQLRKEKEEKRLKEDQEQQAKQNIEMVQRNQWLDKLAKYVKTEKDGQGSRCRFNYKNGVVLTIYENGVVEDVNKNKFYITSIAVKKDDKFTIEGVTWTPKSKIPLQAWENDKRRIAEEELRRFEQERLVKEAEEKKRIARVEQEKAEAKKSELELFIREHIEVEDLYAYKGAIFEKEGGMFGKYIEKPFTGLVKKMEQKVTFGVVKEENKTIDGKYKAVKACDYEEARQIIEKIRKERGEDRPSGVILDYKRSKRLSRGRSR